MVDVTLYTPNEPAIRYTIEAITLGEVIKLLSGEFVKKKKLIFSVDVHLDRELLKPTAQNEARALGPDSQLVLVQNLSSNVTVLPSEARVAWVFAI